VYPWSGCSISWELSRRKPDRAEQLCMLLQRNTVPQGLKATRQATLMPGINPRPTSKRTLLSCVGLFRPTARRGGFECCWPYVQMGSIRFA
jgi:hypothetical protein